MQLSGMFDLMIAYVATCRVVYYGT